MRRNLFLFLCLNMHLISSIANAVKWLIVLLGKNAELILFTGIQYLLIAGVFYLFFYTRNKKKYRHAKIQQRYSEKKHIIRDLKYSFSTIIIDGVIVILVFWASKHGYTQIYKPVDRYGYAWYFFSILLIIIMHDTYFYWTHRLLHWKPLFKWVHKTHHLSRNPTPFSSYAFHPAEAVINAGILPLVAFTIPAHLSVIVIFTIYQLLINVYGHLGYELYPPKFINHWLTKWSNTSTHHNLHHQFVKCNYGLYFNFWDRVMKTNHAKYEEYFEGVVGQREPAKVIYKAQVEEVSAEF